MLITSFVCFSKPKTLSVVYRKGLGNTFVHNMKFNKKKKKKKI